MATKAATATSGGASEKVITEGVDNAGSVHDVSQRIGWSRAGSRDVIDAPHGAAAMWADGNLVFDESPRRLGIDDPVSHPGSADWWNGRTTVHSYHGVRYRGHGNVATPIVGVVRSKIYEKNRGARNIPPRTLRNMRSAQIPHVGIADRESYPHAPSIG